MSDYRLSNTKNLIEGCRKGISLAQETLYKRYYGQMMSICIRYTRNEGEALEIMHDGFMKIFDSLKNYKDQGTFEGWMRTIMFHVAIDFVRKKTAYRKKTVLDNEAEGEIDCEALQELYMKDLVELIQRLPDAQRSVFSLYMIEGYNHREVAGILDIPEGSSKWYLMDAKKRVRELIAIYCPKLCVNG